MYKSIRADKTMKKDHNEVVNKIADQPEISGIEGLSSKTLLHQPIKFPTLKKKGQETGDLIFIWSSAPKKWVISVIEVRVGTRGPLGKQTSKLEMTFKYLRTHWREWFKSLGLDLPKGYVLWIRTVVLSYGGKPLWEQPFKAEIRTQRLHPVYSGEK